MSLRDHYHGSWPARQHRDPRQKDTLFGIVQQVRSVADDHGIDDAYEEITVTGDEEDHTIASLQDLDRSFCEKSKPSNCPIHWKTIRNWN